MRCSVSLGLLLLSTAALAQAPPDPRALQLADVFELEYVRHPAISPDGETVAYERVGFDVMTDSETADVYTVGFDGSRNLPLLTDARSPVWSPDGRRLAYVAKADGKPQLFVHHFAEGRGGVDQQITHLTESPSGVAWSPDGTQLAFLQYVAYAPGASVVELPPKPEGATWADAPIYIDRLKYRADGQGYLKPRYRQIFVVSATGGTARQLTHGAYDHSDPTWAPDGSAIVFSANASEDELNTADTNLGRVGVSFRQNPTNAVDSNGVTWLTERDGPDHSPAFSPDGKRLAFLGYDDRRLGYHNTELYLADANGANPRSLTAGLDRGVDAFAWTGNGELIIQYDDRGDTYLARVETDGDRRVLTREVGGQSLGRPYSGGEFSTHVGAGERYAFTLVGPDHPADLAVGEGDDVRRVTRLNDDLAQLRDLAEVREITVESSADGRDVQAWVMRPAGFDESKKYPLLLEIHGGPYTNYGNRFSMEDQLYAAAGYVVAYVNPRGSTSYGAEFANLIENDYPGKDYDDLMSVVDAVIAEGYIDEERLYVTGGSGGGVLTAWIVGKTDRFAAAVVAKPVINWASFVLTADNTAFFTEYWFSAAPYEDYEQYWRRSPLSLVGDVTTPTMLLTGEQDYRTPIAETEQYYAALKLAGVETAMVRIQDSGHGIARRPSNLMAKVSAVLGWMGRY